VFQAQRLAFEQLIDLVIDVKRDLYPKLLLAVENINRHFSQSPPVVPDLSPSPSHRSPRGGSGSEEALGRSAVSPMEEEEQGEGPHGFNEE
jgi:hypothetical protein